MTINLKQHRRKRWWLRLRDGLVEAMTVVIAAETAMVTAMVMTMAAATATVMLTAIATAVAMETVTVTAAAVVVVEAALLASGGRWNTRDVRLPQGAVCM